jgi:hypothetical protein
MMAATRARRRVTGELLEDMNKNPSKLLKELSKIQQKKKQKKDESVIQEKVPEQRRPEPVVIDNVVEELPYMTVQPLPIVTRGQGKAKSNVLNKDDTEQLLALPKLVVEPGFKNRAPLQLDERAKDLVQEALKNQICITTEDLLNVSEPIRQEFRKLLTKSRLEKKSVTFAAEVDHVDEEIHSKQEHVETISVDRLPEATYEVLAEDTDGMSKGSVIVSDPVMQYFNTLAPGEEPKSVIVAAESHALRTVYPLINGVGEVESLLDPGSQIVSMSKSVATMLQVVWNMDIVVHMESANKSLERTLGLAKNVPFLFGTIIVYLQVHVLGNAAYEVLLGRPFDIVTVMSASRLYAWILTYHIRFYAHTV